MFDKTTNQHNGTTGYNVPRDFHVDDAAERVERFSQIANDAEYWGTAPLSEAQRVEAAVLGAHIDTGVTPVWLNHSLTIFKDGDGNIYDRQESSAPGGIYKTSRWAARDFALRNP